MRNVIVALLVVLLPAAASAQEGNARALALAKKSSEGREAMAFLKGQASKIQDVPLREAVQSILEDPAPTFMELYPDAASKDKVRQELVDAGLLDAAVTTDQLFPPLADPHHGAQPFLAAPGGPLETHHAHPGGLAVHTAFNLQSALDLETNYEKRYGLELDHDIVIAAPILHDSMKSWVLQWQNDGTLTVQPSIAKTASHHIFGIAEAIHRKLRPGFVVALASAHTPPTGADAATVVGYIRAASILARVDPVADKVLVKDGEKGFSAARLPSIEAVINHLSDHDFVLTESAFASVADSLDRLAKADPSAPGLGEGRLRWMRLRIESQVPAMRLYSILRNGGDAAVLAELKRCKVPLLDPSDAVTD